MFYVILIPGIVLLVAGGMTVLFSGAASQTKTALILTDLGLKKRWWGGKGTAFYRWSWRKTSKERVWGERIVKEAFRRHRVWLTLSDHEYFEQQCLEFERTHKANDSVITNRVEEIIRRTEEIENKIVQSVRDILQRLSSISESEARQFLHDSGINLDGKERILQRYATLEVRRLADKVGFSILGHHSGNVELNGDDASSGFPIAGMEGWERWLSNYKEILLQEIQKNMNSSNHMVLESLASSIRAGLLKDYEQDVQGYYSFLQTLEKQIEDKHFTSTIEKIEELERILYTWQFGNQFRFNNVDHNRIRQFLSRTDLSSRFRQFVQGGLETNFHSIHSIVSSFPRHVVFFGKNGFARAYAADQYHLHLERVLEVFARVAQSEPKPPGILTMTDTEIDQRRKEISAENRGAVLQGKAMDVIQTSCLAIQETMDKKKQRSLEKRTIDDPEIGESLGWLIDFPWDEQNVEVFGLFREGPFRLFLTINCDAYGNVDFLTNNLAAKRQRMQYFNQVLDLLLRSSPVQMFTSATLNAS